MSDQNEPFYLRYYSGHSGRFGHEFLEFDFRSLGDGRSAAVRYANNSNYRNDSLIRKEMCVSSLMIQEVKRIIKESEIIKEDDSKWPQKNKDGRQELEIRVGNEHISFETAKIGSLVDVTESADPEGLRVFYYLVQDLKALIFSLISLHFKVCRQLVELRKRLSNMPIPYVDQAHLNLVPPPAQTVEADCRQWKPGVEDVKVSFYLFVFLGFIHKIGHASKNGDEHDCSDDLIPGNEEKKGNPNQTTRPNYAKMILDLNLNLNPKPIEWHPRYMACLQHFVNHSQHTPFVQSVAAFVNIRLPFQRRPDPVHYVRGLTEEEKENLPSSAASEQKEEQYDPFPPLQSKAVYSLSQSSSPSSFISLRQYIRRLIVTGRDSSSILQAFFGDDWVAGVGPIRQQERVNYLFTAKSSGWASTKEVYDIPPDEYAPFLRPLVQPEEEEIRLAEGRWSEWLAMEDWMVGPRSPW